MAKKIMKKVAPRKSAPKAKAAPKAVAKAAPRASRKGKAPAKAKTVALKPRKSAPKAKADAIPAAPVSGKGRAAPKAPKAPTSSPNDTIVKALEKDKKDLLGRVSKLEAQAKSLHDKLEKEKARSRKGITHFTELLDSPVYLDPNPNPGRGKKPELDWRRDIHGLQAVVKAFNFTGKYHDNTAETLDVAENSSVVCLCGVPRLDKRGSNSHALGRIALYYQYTGEGEFDASEPVFVSEEQFYHILCEDQEMYPGTPIREIAEEAAGFNG